MSASRFVAMVAAALLAAPTVSGADMQKVLHVAFVAPENGFDPQATGPNGPERAKLYRDMSKLVIAYAPWVLHTYRIENIVVHPRVEGYKYNTFDPHPWMHVDLDLAQRQRVTR